MSKRSMLLFGLSLSVLTACEYLPWSSPAKANVQTELIKHLKSDTLAIDMTVIFPFEWDYFISLPPGISDSHAFKYVQELPRSRTSELRYVFIKNNKPIRYDAYPWPIVSRTPDNIHVLFSRDKDEAIFVINRSEAKLDVEKIQFTESKTLYSLHRHRIEPLKLE